MRKVLLVLGGVILLVGGYVLITTYEARAALLHAADKAADETRHIGDLPLTDPRITAFGPEIAQGARESREAKLAARSLRIKYWAAKKAVEEFRGVGIASAVIGFLVVLLNVRRTRARFVLSLCLVVLWLGGTAVLVPRANAAVSKNTCIESIRFLGADLLRALDDHRDRAKLADGWCDLLVARMAMKKGGDFFICPDLQGAECTWGLNRNVLAMTDTERESNPHMVLLFETDGGWNIMGEVEAVTKRSRHGGDVPVRFLDGSGASVPLTDISNLQWRPVRTR